MGKDPVQRRNNNGEYQRAFQQVSFGGNSLPERIDMELMQERLKEILQYDTETD